MHDERAAQASRCALCRHAESPRVESEVLVDEGGDGKVRVVVAVLQAARQVHLAAVVRGLKRFRPKLAVLRTAAGVTNARRHGPPVVRRRRSTATS